MAKKYIPQPVDDNEDEKRFFAEAMRSMPQQTAQQRANFERAIENSKQPLDPQIQAMLAKVPVPSAAPRVFPEIMTIEDVAAYLDLHPQVIYRHVRNGTIPTSRIGRTLRFKKSVLDAFLEQDAWKSVGKFLKYVDQRGKKEKPATQRGRFSADID